MRESSLLVPLAAIMLLASVSLPSPRSYWVAPAYAAPLDGYNYYGFVPKEIWGLEWVNLGTIGWELRIEQPSIADSGLVAIVGNHDGTRVNAYILPGGELLKEFTLNRLEKASCSLPNGTFFKLVASRPVTVFLLGGKYMESGDAFANMFVTSTEGGYVGREFIFMAVQAKRALHYTGLAYRVYALEDSQVTVWDANGSQVTQFTLRANQLHELGFTPMAVYRLESTGNVMLQSFTMWTSARLGFPGTCFYPAVRGGFVGTLFYGGTGTNDLWPPFSPPTFVITGLEDSKITVFDLENRRKYLDAELLARGNFSKHMDLSHMVVESEKPIVLMVEGNGVSYAGLSAGETGYFWLPLDEPYSGAVPGGSVVGSAGEAYLYIADETVVTVDDVTVRLGRDAILPLQHGFHAITAYKNVVIQLINYPWQSYPAHEPSIARFSDFGTCIPSVQAMSIRNPGLNPPSVTGQELPWPYILAAAIAVIVIAAWAMRRRRPGSQKA